MPRGGPTPPQRSSERVYTRPMRPRSALIVLICMSLLGLQASGLHLHVSPDGVHGAPAGHHLHTHGHGHTDGAHTHGPDGHDRDDDTDVSLAKPGTIGAKIPLGLVSLASILFALASTTTRVAPSLSTPVPAGCRIRWRPPLRAPPAQLSRS